MYVCVVQIVLIFLIYNLYVYAFFDVQAINVSKNYLRSKFLRTHAFYGPQLKGPLWVVRKNKHLLQNVYDLYIKNYYTFSLNVFYLDFMQSNTFAFIILYKTGLTFSSNFFRLKFFFIRC